LNGATQVICADRFPSLAETPLQLSVYRSMRSKLD
jgi:hypothetical protein